MTRTEIALSTLRNGGYFRKALETQYRGGEKFCMRLRDHHGNIIKGVGFKTFFELEAAGKLAYRPCPRSSTWPEEYILNRLADAA